MLYTAQFLTVNGLSLSLTRLDEDVEDVEAFSRGGGKDLALDGMTYAPKRRWKFETAPIAPHEAEALVGWIEARGVQWLFNRTDTAASFPFTPDAATVSTTRFTWAGTDGAVLAVFPSAASNTVTRASGWRSTVTQHGVWAAQISCTSTAYDGTSATYPFSTVAYTLPFGVEQSGRISMSLWAMNTAGDVADFTLLSTIWNTDHSYYTALFYVGTTATLPDGTGLPFRSTNEFTATVGWSSFRLLSGASSNSVSTALFSSVMVVPYALTGDMLAARAGRGEAEATFPYVYLSGHALQDASEVVVKGFVEERSPTRAAIGGVWYDNAEILSGVFVEK